MRSDRPYESEFLASARAMTCRRRRQPVDRRVCRPAQLELCRDAEQTARAAKPAAAACFVCRRRVQHRERATHRTSPPIHGQATSGVTRVQTLAYLLKKLEGGKRSELTCQCRERCGDFRRDPQIFSRDAL